MSAAGGLERAEQEAPPRKAIPATSNKKSLPTGRLFLFAGIETEARKRPRMADERRRRPGACGAGSSAGS